jgi:hypothetical protein
MSGTQARDLPPPALAECHTAKVGRDRELSGRIWGITLISFKPYLSISWPLGRKSGGEGILAEQLLSPTSHYLPKAASGIWPAYRIPSYRNPSRSARRIFRCTQSFEAQHQALQRRRQVQRLEVMTLCLGEIRRPLLDYKAPERPQLRILPAF